MRDPRTLTSRRLRRLLAGAARSRVLVIGDVMLDQYIWGQVRRISPEAPVPVVEFERESFMPGGAANVARNLTALKAPTELIGAVGADPSGTLLKLLLSEERVGCDGVLVFPRFATTLKTRIIAHQQQVVRVDRETSAWPGQKASFMLMEALKAKLCDAAAVIVGDYGKGVITQPVLDEIKQRCRQRGVWLSLDPKPVHSLDLRGLSLITPNRKEAFALAGGEEQKHAVNPLADEPLMEVARRLLGRLQPAILLITLGEQGMLLCQRGEAPIHIRTVAQEVFDVSGAGDTVIASFTLAIAAGAAPLEAAMFSNHAAGVVVGKVGTATVTPEELIASSDAST